MSIRESLSKSNIPLHICDSILLYIEHGTPPGSCLSAIFNGDLYEAYARADEEVAAHMGDIVKFIVNNAPTGCWGWRDSTATWIKMRGLNGLYNMGSKS